MRTSLRSRASSILHVGCKVQGTGKQVRKKNTRPSIAESHWQPSNDTRVYSNDSCSISMPCLVFGIASLRVRSSFNMMRQVNFRRPTTSNGLGLTRKFAKPSDSRQKTPGDPRAQSPDTHLDKLCSRCHAYWTLQHGQGPQWHSPGLLLWQTCHHPLPPTSSPRTLQTRPSATSCQYP